MPLANAFLHSPAEFAAEPFYPLDVYFCETCSLVQLLDRIDPEVLFRNYIYVTSTSDTIATHNKLYAQTIIDFLKLETGDLVVEVGSNDGSLLKHFKEYRMRVLGIDPAMNIARMARSSGIETISQFFNSCTAQDIRESHGLAKVIIGNNVLAHVNDTQDFLRGCKILVEEDGFIVIEVPYLRNLIDQLEYDTIYHEHLCYFSINALIRLYDTVGLSIIRIDHVPVHGGSLRIYARVKERCSNHAEDVLALAEGETHVGLTEFAYYERFAADVETNRCEILDMIETLHRAGKMVAGYGAPAKGNTLLNYCGIDTRLIPYTVDKNPMKVGLYTPGMHIPVLPVSTLGERRPAYLLVLAWNFADEIMRQQREFHDHGGRLIIPIPKPRVV